jgi:hypothetical protein
VPLGGPDSKSPISICLLVRRNSSANPFIVVYESKDVLVYLGCITDKSNNAKEWLEIWKQAPVPAHTRLGTLQAPLTNSESDRLWQTRMKILTELDPQAVIVTGWEENHLPPLFLDLDDLQVIRPADRNSGRNFVLCQDEAALAKAGLPSYRASSERFLWNSGEEPVFLATRPGEIDSIEDVHQVFEGLVAFNLDAGLLAVRRLSPMRFEEAADLLGGESWEGLKLDGRRIHLDHVYQLATDYNQLVSEGAHFLENRNPTGTRLIEVLHLKLNLIFQAFSLTHRATQILRSPFLNLRPESFRVRLSQTGNGLPFLWSSIVDLVEAPSAHRIDLSGTDSSIFVSEPEQSIFQSGPASRKMTGYGSLRIRQLFAIPENRTGMELTFVTDERLGLLESDIVHFVLPITGLRLDIFARKISNENVTLGETRLRSVGQRFSTELCERLTNAVGPLFKRVEFEVLPCCSSVNDLYSLAILAMRTLLVDNEATLPIVVDELTQLARQIAQSYSEKEPWRERLRAILRNESRWNDSLGPYRLTRETSLRSRASYSIPIGLWWSILGWLVRLLPGIGPDSYCPDSAAVPETGFERVFERPIADLRALQARTRSLLFADWIYSEEVRNAIDTLVEDELYAPKSASSANGC